MPQDNTVANVEFDISRRIDATVEKMAEDNVADLPDVGSPLVEDYIRKIEGKYDVSRSKSDTDNAVDLLYIAYNTVPQKHGSIRKAVSNLMGDLITAQGDSKIAMDKATTVAGDLNGTVRDFYKDWRRQRADTEDGDGLYEFLTEDMVDLADEIKTQAELVAQKLHTVAETYNTIIGGVDTATNDAEIELGKEITDREALQAEINKNNAEKEKLEYLVKDLEASITKYERMAAEYASRADTAEKRAFIMSIVRVGAEMIAAVAPAITAGLTGAATGGSSIVAANAMNSAKQATSREAAAEPDDNTAEIIEQKKEALDAKADKEAAEARKAEIEAEVESLKDEKAAVEADEDKGEDTKQAEVAAIEERIKTKDEEIAEQNAKIENAKTAIKATQAALESLSGNMKEMAQEQKDQAASLRELQMDMLNKVEKYETEKRNQEAALVKLKALLKGQRTEQETIELAIKSLNLAIAALKRMRGIIVEIAFFFQSFAAFMDEIVADADKQAKALQKVIDKGKLGSSGSRRRIVQATSEFFISQAGEWLATQIVSSKFVANFDEGHTKLNRLSMKYLTEDELVAYLDVARNRIDEIAFEREEAARERSLSLAEYRAKIEAEAGAA